MRAIVGVLLLSCATTTRSSGRELSAAVTLPLSPYMKTDLRTVKVEIAGQQVPFLFDTGGGVTVISPELATAVGCTPSGRLTAHRMSGDRIDAPRCSGVALSLGGVAVKTDAVVMELAKLMPPEWEKVHGLVSVQTIEDVPFTLALRRGELVLETPQSLQARIGTMRRVELRVARPAAGAAVDLFVKVEAKPAPLWMILDSGNIDRVVLAPHAAKAEGLSIAGEPLTLPNREMDIIYDGNLGTAFLLAHPVTVDLPTGRMWLQ